MHLGSLCLINAAAALRRLGTTYTRLRETEGACRRVRTWYKWLHDEATAAGFIVKGFHAGGYQQQCEINPDGTFDDVLVPRSWRFPDELEWGPGASLHLRVGEVSFIINIEITGDKLCLNGLVASSPHLYTEVDMQTALEDFEWADITVDTWHRCEVQQDPYVTLAGAIRDLDGLADLLDGAGVRVPSGYLASRVDESFKFRARFLG